ncbi:MAG TPA: ATP-binding cassette domain-containing protein [Thermoanaerobaculia bacterium]
MLDVSLDKVSFQHGRSGFRIDDLTCVFPRSSITAIVGAAGSGKSTLLRLASGHHKVKAGTIRIGSRDATLLPPRERPLFSSAFDTIPPPRWSAQHVLIAALRERKLDLEDRRVEFDLAVDKWRLSPLLERKLSTLSPAERLRLRLSQIETLRPAVFVADRFLQDASTDELPELIREIGSSLRMIGSTVITEISTLDELSMCDRAVVMDAGRIIQSGTPKDVYDRPINEASARALGDVNTIPIVIRGSSVESPIGDWSVASPPFEGEGVALARPGDFSVVSPGEDSDFIFSIEQASFRRGEWLLRGFLTGAHLLTVTLSASMDIHKGKLLPLRYDPHRWTLVPKRHSGIERGPTGAVPTLRDSR